MVKNITKIVAIFVLSLFTTSCISFYTSSTRDVDRCVIAAVNPKVGTVKDAIDANYENWVVNIPHCNDQFDTLDIE